MALEFEPTDSLVFQRPLIHANREVILLKNPNSEAIIFRIKTTAPKQYCVRPNNGRLDSLGQIEIEVILKPFKAEPPVYFKCNDKFLIQSAQIQRHQYDGTPATEVWQNIETQNSTAIHHHRIKCTFASNLLKTTTNHLTTPQGEPSTRTNMVESTSSSLQHKENAFGKAHELDTSSSSTTTTLHHLSAYDTSPQLPIPILLSANETDLESSSLTHRVPLTSTPDLDNTSTHKSSTPIPVHQLRLGSSQRLTARLFQTYTVKGLPSLVLIFMCVAVSCSYFFF